MSRLGIVLSTPIWQRAVAADSFAHAPDTAAFNASIASALKDLKPETQQLAFMAGKGFHWDCVLHRKFTYAFSLDAACDPATNQLENVKPELSGLKSFLAAAESDTRGRLILDNNASGKPAILILTGRGPGAGIEFIIRSTTSFFTPADKQWNYSYAGEVAKFAALPEIKRAQSDPAVRAFIGAASAVRVAATGNPKTFFDCSFLAENGKTLKVRVDGKNVKTLTE